MFVALSLTCLLGFLALANGVGMRFFTRRYGQKPARFAIMLPPPLTVVAGKLEFGGTVDAVIEATNTARAGGASGLENLLAAYLIRGMVNYPIRGITNYPFISYSPLG